MNPATSPEWRKAARARRDASPAAPRRAGPLEHCLGQFLDKERNSVGLGDDLRHYLGGQWPAGDMLGQGRDLGGGQAVERYAGDVRQPGPGASYSGRKVININTGKARNRSTIR